MNAVLTKNGLYSEKWIAATRTYSRSIAEEDIVFTYLRERCIIEEGVTFLDIVRILSKYEPLILFFSQYSWFNRLSEYIESLNDSEIVDNIEYLEVFWYANCFQLKNFQLKDENKIELSPSFQGVGKEKEGKRILYGVSDGMGLAKIPVKLNESANFYDEKGNVIFSGKKDFTLHEVIDAMFWEISFFRPKSEES